MHISAASGLLPSLFKPLQWFSAPVGAVSNPQDSLAPANCLHRLDVTEDKAEEKRLLDQIIQVPNLAPDAAAVLRRDLEAFPVPLLRLLAADDLLVVGMRAGQTLADTPRLPTVKPEEYRSHVQQARILIDECLVRQGDQKEHRIRERVAAGEDPVYVEAMENHWWARSLQDDLSQRLVEAGIGFSVEVKREPFTLSHLATGREVGPDDRAAWEETFTELNQGLVSKQGDQISATQGIVLIPYAYYRGRAVSEVTLKQALEYKAQRARDAMGIHNYEERMITLYEDYLRDPAPEAGHHRVSIHETGHALDHALERVQGIPGLGAEHRATIDRLYAEDIQLLKQGQDRFTSARAKDNVREYFAEAVESYLTVPMSDGQDYYKPTNNRIELQRLNPALYAYLDRIFHLDIPPGVELAA